MLLLKLPIRVTLAALALIQITQAQSPLPEIMHPAFSPGKNYAERMTITSPSSNDEVSADIIFESQAERSVTINWRARASGAFGYGIETKHATSFEPTAIARHAGSSNIFYVVGWWPGSSRVVVEKWHIQPLAIGTVANPGGTVNTVLSEPSIRRALVWISNPGELSPIWDAAALPYSDELWLLESGAITRIYSLDINSTSNTLLFSSDATGMAELAELRSFAVGKHPTAGFVITASPRRPWISKAALKQTAPMFVAIDDDLNGSIDSTFFDVVGNYSLLFPLPWDLTYTAP